MTKDSKEMKASCLPPRDDPSPSRKAIINALMFRATTRPLPNDEQQNDKTDLEP